MRCEDVTTQLADYLAGTLPDEALEAIRAHVATCATCHDEVVALEDTWQLLGSIDPVRPDSAGMRARFDAVLDGYEEGRRGRPHVSLATLLASLWRPRVLAQVAAAAAMLLVGILVGRQLAAPAAGAPAAAPSADSQVAALRAELGDMRQMVILSLLQQQSASDRLRGVGFTDDLAEPGTEVVSALLDALRHDANVNVRLASIDALRRFGSREEVRESAIAALPRQTSPMVQIALIDFVLEAAGKGSIPLLQQLAADTMLDRAVRSRAERGLQQLGVTL